MDSTYAPQSPDLSSFLSSPPKTQQPYNPQSTSISASYAPRSPVIPSFGTAAPPQTEQYHTLHASYENHNQQQQQPFVGGAYDGTSDFNEYANTQYMPTIPALPASHSFGPQQPFYSPNAYPPQTKPEDAVYAADFGYASATMTSRQPRGKGASSSQPLMSSLPPYKNPNPNNIEIKTKFPVARIKRIMQADEEVGKVAQVTPVAVSKALELFMIALVEGAAEKAKEKGGKRVTAQHLKQVVLASPDQYDFLNEIVGRVADQTEGAGGEGRKRKEKVDAGSESSEEEKKPKKGKGRRKKSDD